MNASKKVLVDAKKAFVRIEIKIPDSLTRKVIGEIADAFECFGSIQMLLPVDNYLDKESHTRVLTYSVQQDHEQRFTQWFDDLAREQMLSFESRPISLASSLL